MFVTKPLFQSTIFFFFLNQYGKYKVVVPEQVKEYHFTGKRLLLVEDNTMNLEIAYEILTEAGLTVDCAKDGIEAVDCFINSKPGTYQIILMDIQMPKMNGYEATIEIRRSEHPDASKVQILAMTANVFTEEIAKSISSGMNDHISKPIDADILFQTLAKHLN